MTQNQTLIAQLTQHLSPHRLAHSTRVSDVAKNLARHHNLDPTNAEIAGLIHDCAKEMTPTDLNALGIQLDDAEQAIQTTFPALLHAWIAPKVIPKCFNIDSPEILSAAKWHSTGRPNMSVLEQIIFIADYIEPGRKFTHVSTLNTIAETHLDHATFAIADLSLSYLEKQSKKIHPIAIECRDYFAHRIGTQSKNSLKKQLHYD